MPSRQSTKRDRKAADAAATIAATRRQSIRDEARAAVGGVAAIGRTREAGRSEAGHARESTTPRRGTASARARPQPKRRAEARDRREEATGREADRPKPRPRKPAAPRSPPPRPATPRRQRNCLADNEAGHHPQARDPDPQAHEASPIDHHDHAPDQLG